MRYGSSLMTSSTVSCGVSLSSKILYHSSYRSWSNFSSAFCGVSFWFRFFSFFAFIMSSSTIISCHAISASSDTITSSGFSYVSSSNSFSISSIFFVSSFLVSLNGVSSLLFSSAFLCFTRSLFCVSSSFFASISMFALSIIWFSAVFSSSRFCLVFSDFASLIAGSTFWLILCVATLFLDAGFLSVAILSDELVYVMFWDGHFHMSSRSRSVFALSAL